MFWPPLLVAVGGGLFYGLTSPGGLDWHYPVLGAGLGAGYGLAQVFLARTGRLADSFLLPVAAMLTVLGLLFIARLDPTLAQRQFTWAIVGLAVMLLIAVGLPDYRRLAEQGYTHIYATLGLSLLAVTVIAGSEAGGAKAWLTLGSFRFQPAEGVKVLMVVFLASYLRRYGHTLAIPRTATALPPLHVVAPLIAFAGLSLLFLVAQRDLGTAIIFYSTFLAMLYLATARLAYVGGGLGIFALGAVFSFYLYPHVQGRVLAWLDPWAYINTYGYQVVQSLFALGAGGLLGTGLGLGRPDVIPAVTTDFIFAAVGEEMGLAGSLGLLALYLLLVARGYAIARKADDAFGVLLAAGLTSLLAIQTLVIVGGVTRLLPLTGITLPFMSYGGSSLVTNYAIVGLLLRVTPGEERQPGHPLTVIIAAVMALFLAVVAQLTYWQFFQAEALAANPHNPRFAAMAGETKRGGIYDRHGELLAETRGVGNGFARYYPLGEVTAPVLGYVSPRYGQAGLEEAANAELMGLGGRAGLDNRLRRLVGQKARGYNLQLTLDAGLQRLAMDLLQGRRGAVVVMRPQGQILALASRPTIDPNRIDTLWEQWQKDPESPLLNRAVQGLYPPGSSFKIVTGAAVIARRPDLLGKTYFCPGEVVIEGRRLGCWGVHGEVDFSRAMAVSCNVAFAEMALALGGENLTGAAEAFWFNRPLPFELPVKPGYFPDLTAAQANDVAESAIGQGRVLVTPLQMAAVTAAVAGGGRMFRPYLVERVLDAERTVRAVPPTPLGNPVTPEVAGRLAASLELVVSQGTGGRAGLPGVAVAGKTGSAENPHGPAHAWFTGFAPARGAEVVVTVLLENQGSGGEAAAPLAGKLLAAALEKAGVGE
ncbi:MAG: hypothetical protein D9V47_12780 [Clostridia bacterium]|nr:MAG: hypothetical protein D9V47_12780 [Clostridia bacterium]